MPDKENVIKGLEETEIMLSQAVDRGGDMSVMGAFNCLNHVIDTLGLLKEQEPRLITLEEVKNHNNKDNCVWFELRDIVVIPVFARQDRQETVIENPCILSDQTIPHLYWKNIDYCKAWRCWSSRPTDEQREAVKWE